MGTAQDRLMRQMFVAMLLFTAVFLAVGTLYPVQLHTAGMKALRWIYLNILDTWWFTYVFLTSVFGAIALILFGFGAMIYTHLRKRYRKWRDPNWKQYTDPDYRD